MIGSIFSASPKLTSGIHKATKAIPELEEQESEFSKNIVPQLTWHQLRKFREHFMAPPLFGHKTHCALMLSSHGAHNQLPFGILSMP